LGKSRRGLKEKTREQSLIFENQRLKLENNRLKKALAKRTLDPYDSVKEAIEEHCEEKNAGQGRDILDNMKQKWRCSHANCTGFLEIFLYSKVNSTWYYRICSKSPVCKNRTKAKKYTEEVKGLFRKAANEKLK
jgi:hypothetical protein